MVRFLIYDGSLIFNYFSSKESVLLDDERCVLVKVIVTSDGNLRDSIIKATNNQTMVESTSLYATDKIQRDIEEILLQSGLYYERRKNFYLNQGVSVHDLITLQYLASAYLALVLKSPAKAVSLRPKVIRDEEKYKIIFNENTNIRVWVALARIFKSIDKYLQLHRSKSAPSEKFLKKWRYLVGLLILSKYYGRFDFSVNEIIEYNHELIVNESVLEVVNDIEVNISAKSLPVSNGNISKILNYYETKYGVKNKMIVFKANPYSEKNFGINANRINSIISDNFLNKVKEILPPQPWKPYMEKEIIKVLGCSRREYFDAVRLLIKRGDFYRQRDGILYDRQGTIVGFDEHRVESANMKLIENPL
ncbi:hypothetical protein E2K52_13325 [Acinetobacter sp. RF14B]|nr:hypothetical protein E2K52_13325 [Acinetobacter sp. RF14B]